MARLKILEYKDGDRYIAHCLELDLVAEGTTTKEAKENLNNLFSSYLQFAKENDIEQFAYHPAPKVYWDKFEKEYQKSTKTKEEKDLLE